MASGRILTKDLDTRIKQVEDRLGELAEKLANLDETVRQATHRVDEAAQQMRAQSHNGHSDGHSDTAPSGKLAELEGAIAGLNERVEKITQTLVTQASRWT